MEATREWACEKIKKKRTFTEFSPSRVLRAPRRLVILRLVLDNPRQVEPLAICALGGRDLCETCECGVGDVAEVTVCQARQSHMEWVSHRSCVQCFQRCYLRDNELPCVFALFANCIEEHMDPMMQQPQLGHV